MVVLHIRKPLPNGKGDRVRQLGLGIRKPLPDGKGDGVRQLGLGRRDDPRVPRSYDLWATVRWVPGPCVVP